jgi:hypothetical protein
VLRVLRYLLDHGPASQADLIRALGKDEIRHFLPDLGMGRQNILVSGPDGYLIHPSQQSQARAVVTYWENADGRQMSQ